MKAPILIAAALLVALTLGPSLFDDIRTFRWGKDSEVEALSDKLNNELGKSLEQETGWQIVADLPMDATSRNQLQPIGYKAWTLRNPESGQQMNLFVLLGPTGPTAVHTPDICFSSRDFRKIGERKPEKLAGSELWVTNFESRENPGQKLKSWYGWTTADVWEASENPRYQFATSRYLFKLQASAAYPEGEAGEKSVEEAREFLEKFLREFEGQF